MAAGQRRPKPGATHP